MRALARWGITPLLAAPFGVWALGLGDIELESNLNQPFRARIALSATPEELQGLRVTLAGAEAFERYGLDRPGYFSNFEFRIVPSGSGGGRVVEVSTPDSVSEPFVTLLVEAIWPRGRTLREYTVLLDPPVLLPVPTSPPAVRPAETRAPSPTAPEGPINREASPAMPPAEPSAEPEPRVSAVAPPLERAPVVREPVAPEGGVYGPVRRAETLSQIAQRVRPDGVTLNQMMIAIFEANPKAFGGNINLLLAGATLRLPPATAFESLAARAATVEVQRQIDEWRARPARAGGQLRLLPPSETAVARATTPTPAPAPTQEQQPAAGGTSPAPDQASAADAEESRRLLALRDAELQRLQQQAAGEPLPAPEAAESAAPGVELESEQVFADESAPPEPSAEPAPAPVEAAPAPQATSSEPSLIARVLTVAASPFLLIGLGVAALLFSALWFVRRRRSEPEDVTGRWEALEAERDEAPETREATERLRRQLPEETIVVEEQRAEAIRPGKSEPAAAAPTRSAAPAKAPRATAADETLSSQAVINLDHADAVAEADFHIAYGLYDQAADLVQKALNAAPERRDLRLKLLEVFFMWGNKDAFLKAAKALRAEIGADTDADWDKVVIMGRQICPGEQLFADAGKSGGRVDLDLDAGDSPLDLAFDDGSEEAAGSAAKDSLDFTLESTGSRPAAAPPRPATKAAVARDLGSEALDIGAMTAAGLEAALFEPPREDNEDTGRRTRPDLAVDSLAVTQESPTIERGQGDDWATVENSSSQYSAEAPTVETPMLGNTAGAKSATSITRTLAVPRRNESPTVEQPSLAASGEFTAEIDLDDLGLDVKDLEGLPGDLGDLPAASGADTDTREQRALRGDDALLSATGVTKVLDVDDDGDNTSVLEDRDATQLAPGFGSTLTGTEVLEGRQGVDEETGATSLVKSLGGRNDLDLDLEDLTTALHGADTVEQPRANSFARDVFAGGGTPLDMDIGLDVASDEDPTGNVEAGGFDPQTMTEIGTKLDLARAYIDMGDPEGARSILEEVLGEGDANQRSEAQSLIDALSA